MATDKKISQLTNFTPIKDGIMIPCTVNVDGALKTRMIVTEDFAPYLAPSVLGNLICGRGIDIKAGTEAGQFIISCDLDTSLYKIVDELPSEGIETSKIYLISENGPEGNVYVEYGYLGSEKGWEELGRHKADTDLSKYLTESAFETAKSSLETAIAEAKSTASNADAKANQNAIDIASLTTKVSTLETESGKHALQSDLNMLKTAQEKDAADIVELNTKIGKHSVAASEGVEAVEGTGLLKELEDLESGYKAADKTLDDRLTTAENTLKGVATTDGLATLRDTVTSHGTAISNLQTESASHATSTEVNEKVGVVDAKLANYVTTEVYEAHLISVSDTYETKTDITKKLGLKADQSALDSLLTKVTNLEDTAKTYQTGTQVQTAITTAIEGLATETYVDEAVAAADISGKLADYLKSTDASETYATKTSVNDITKVDGIIDTKIKAAKDDLQAKLDTANATITDLTSKLETLTAKLAKYDVRFGYDETTDTWSKSFLLVDE